MVLAEDGKQYLLKHNLSDRLRSNLIREWISYNLYRFFDVSIPPATLLQFDPWPLRDDLTSFSGKYISHVSFGSHWLESFEIKDQFYRYNQPRKLEIGNPEEIAKILVMDIWLKNNDRNAGNLNLIQHRKKIYAIDHAATFDQSGFYQLGDQSLLNNFDEPGDQGALLTGSDFFTLYYKSNRTKFETAGRDLCVRIERSGSSLFTEMLSRFPPEWKLADQEQSAINAFLIFRKDKLREKFEGHLDFNRKLS